VFEDRLVEVGDFVSVGDPVARFVEKQNLVVVGNLAEQHASRVRVGDVGRASLVTGDVVEGRIRYVAPVAEQSTRTFRVELEVPNGDLALPAGVTAELRLPVGEVMAQRVPASLLSLDDDGTLGIKLVDESGRVRFYPADIAASGNDGVWLAGLPAEADVIVVGQGFVGSGDLVRAVAADGDSALAVREAEDAP
jgi:multidrug efflux system membrane fusion protein